MPILGIGGKATDGMSFDKYIDNPSGGGVITNRRMYKELYTGKLDRILVRENGNIDYKVYKNNDDYYIHIKVPSEPIANFYYDVVIKLFTVENSKKTNNSVRNYAVKFYSNDPAFVYTFVHAFEKNNLFINELESKMSKQALKNQAKSRNPKDEVFYVKSLYFAYIIMERKNLFNRTILDKIAMPYKKNVLLNNIEHANDKIEKRQEEQKKIEIPKKENNAPRPQQAGAYGRPTNITKTPHTSIVSNRTRAVGRVKSIKKK